MYMMIYLEAFDDLCFHWRLGLLIRWWKTQPPKQRTFTGSNIFLYATHVANHNTNKTLIVWTKRWKREKPGFNINICTVHQFWSRNAGWLPSLELTSSLPLEIGLYPCPKRNPDRPIPIMFFWFVVLVWDSFRECIITTQMLHTMEYLPTLMA